MKLLSILKTRKYGTLAIILAVAMALIYPYLQVILNGGFFNYFFWFEVILSNSIINFVLYLIFSALFGIVVSFSIYNLTHKTCSIKTSTGSSSFGVGLAIFTSQCSACVSLVTLFLPVTAAGIFSVYSTAFNALSIAVLVLAIYLMRGFKKY